LVGYFQPGTFVPLAVLKDPPASGVLGSTTHAQVQGGAQPLPAGSKERILQIVKAAAAADPVSRVRSAARFVAQGLEAIELAR
jgi:hypothetical protein